MTVYLSRLRLSRDPSVQAVQALLSPQAEGDTLDAQHRLVWSAFATDPDHPRDFLWRDEGKDVTTVLSHRRPEPSPFFEPAEVKPFAPDLRPGDRLRFTLRANATRTIKSDALAPNGKRKRKHIDLVMDALPKENRADFRLETASKVAQIWMSGQGALSGFDLLECGVEHYAVRALPGYKGKRKGQPQFGILDLSGAIALTNPEAFIQKMSGGFGRARAFGCGLMLVRRM